MSLKEVLEKMKLVELEEGAPSPRPRSGVHPVMAPPPPPPPAPPRRPAASAPRATADVLKGVDKTPVDDAAYAKVSPAPGPGGLGEIPDFDAIYKASGVTDPAHGFSASKVLEILSSTDFDGLEPRAKAAALQGFLKMNPAGPVAISDVIQDAVRRDHALEGFDEFLKKKLEQRRAQLDQENEGLQKQIDDLTHTNREKMDQNRRALDGDKERLATWEARKRIEERRLFDAVAPFVEQNPITIGDSEAPGAPKK
jgi:hypothetical protein